MNLLHFKYNQFGISCQGFTILYLQGRHKGNDQVNIYRYNYVWFHSQKYEYPNFYSIKIHYYERK